MKKQTPTAAESHKGFLALAGEALHALGEDIVEGKDMVVDTAAEKFTQLKTAVSRLAHKKKEPKRSAPKKAAKKAPAKNTAKKTPAKKTAKKVAGKKPTPKVAKATSRKA